MPTLPRRRTCGIEPRRSGTRSNPSPTSSTRSRRSNLPVREFKSLKCDELLHFYSIRKRYFINNNPLPKAGSVSAIICGTIYAFYVQRFFLFQQIKLKHIFLKFATSLVDLSFILDRLHLSQVNGYNSI